jgi:hypothetical protein
MTRIHARGTRNTLPAVLNLLAAGILFGMTLAFGVARLAGGGPMVDWTSVIGVCSGVPSLVMGLHQLSRGH